MSIRLDNNEYFCLRYGSSAIRAGRDRIQRSSAGDLGLEITGPRLDGTGVDLAQGMLHDLRGNRSNKPDARSRADKHSRMASRLS